MREIKFRAWDKTKKNIWIVQHISFNDQGEVIACWTNGSDFSKEENTLSDLILMQFTGLKDKNGKEIYEGDLYQVRGSEVFYEVVWNYYKYMFISKGGRSFTPINYNLLHGLVVGNIYENPELLK